MQVEVAVYDLVLVQAFYDVDLTWVEDLNSLKLKWLAVLCTLPNGFCLSQNGYGLVNQRLGILLEPKWLR